MTNISDAKTGVSGRSIRWLILGATGQLGYDWCRRLEETEADFRGFTRHELDITSSVQIEKILDELQPDIVVNCSAYTNVDQAELDIEMANRVNADAVRDLAALCAARKIRLVHYSTDYVFPGLMAHRTRFTDGYPESFPPDPINEYGRSKWLGEQGIQEAGASHLIIRVSWLCGRQGNNFIHTMLRLADQRGHLRVVDDQFGCPTFTDSVITNTIALIESKAEGIFHLTSRGEISWFEFARAIFDLTGRSVIVEPIPSSEYPTRAQRPAWSRLDIKRLSNVPGTRILPWRQNLEEFLKAGN